MRYLALATIAATMLCTIPVRASEPPYVEVTGEWTIMGSRVGHTSIQCMMGRKVESSDSDVPMFLYAFTMNIREHKSFLTVALPTKFPAVSKPQATVTFENMEPIKLNVELEGDRRHSFSVANIIIPNDDDVRQKFTDGINKSSGNMTMVLRLPAANGKPEQKETTTVALDGGHDALQLRVDCMKEMLNDMVRH